MLPPYRLNPRAPLNQGLVAKYICLPGMTGGQYWYDLCQKNKGTLTNMTSGYGWQGALGRPGGWGAMRFDGSDDAITLPSTTLWNFGTTGFAISFWFYPTVGTVYQILVGKDVSGARNWVIAWALAPDKVTWYGGFAGEPSVDSTVLAINRWYHVVVTKVSTTINMYINGAFNATCPNTSNYTLTSAIWLGSREFVGFPQPFNGRMDDISIYNRALSATEVAGLYNASKNQYRNEILCAYE